MNMKLGLMLFALAFVSEITAAQEVVVKPIAKAGVATQRLLTKQRDPSVEAALKRAQADPYPDASTLTLIRSVLQAEEHEWEQAFALDMGNTFGVAADRVNVPFDYPPNPYAIADGFGIVQLLANSVLQAGLPCASIYRVDSNREGRRGWWLECDLGAHTYLIALSNSGEWRLAFRAPPKKRKGS